MRATKEYRVCYKHKEYELEAGQNRYIPDKEIAEAILRKKQAQPLFRNDKLYLSERDCDRELKDCRVYDGKRVLNRDFFYTDALEIGDLVEEEIVDDLLDCLPPACMRRDCSQLGEPQSIRVDENGRERNTYLTFKCLGNKVWEYCGDCFRGENVVKGKEPAYIGGWV